MRNSQKSYRLRRELAFNSNPALLFKRSITLQRHPEGIAQITMADAEEADLLITLMNGRFFGQRKLTAETWDGKTKYK